MPYLLRFPFALLLPLLSMSTWSIWCGDVDERCMLYDRYCNRLWAWCYVWNRRSAGCDVSALSVVQGVGGAGMTDRCREDISQACDEFFDFVPPDSNLEHFARLIEFALLDLNRIADALELLSTPTNKTHGASTLNQDQFEEIDGLLVAKKSPK